MALPILDGNQTAVTLATTVSGGAHYPNHIIASGTVTANVLGYSDNETSYQPIPIVPWDEGVTSGRAVVVKVQQEGVGSLPISGTVTVGNSVTVGSCVTHGVTIANSSVTVNGTFWQATQPVSLDSTTVTVSSLPSISGTVTANVSSTTVTVSALPSGALTTRFGSVTTANTAQLTAAVTNSSRKFLLVQNIATSAVTIGIGFAPTTTQGIQLAAGGGLTFDAFCPTGGVWWLSSAAGSNWSILEG